MRRLLKASLLAAMGWAVAAPASAATLTIVNDISKNGQSGSVEWNLTVETGCTSQCDVTLTADFNTWEFAGVYLQSVQWKVDSYHPSDGLPAGSITLDSTNAGTTADWVFNNGVVVQGGCNALSNQDAVCGDWIGTGDGVGPLAQGDSFEWTFTVDWDNPLALEGLVGNIRSAYSYANGKNFYIFSPNGGSFDVPEQNVEENIAPEPATLVLFGSGLAIAAARLRRRRQNDHV